MRKGALTTGRNICSSMPVETRGLQFVEPKTCRFWEGFGFRMLPPWQLYPAASVGHPKGVPTTWSYCTVAICSCEGRRIGSMPESMKGAIATGPAIVIRYSRFVHTLRSPPGNTIWSTGIGTVQLPSRGLAGFLGTGVPSGLVSEIGRAHV